MASSSFGDLISKILEEPNGTILSKYHDNRLDRERLGIEKKKDERKRATERREMRDENYTECTVVTNAKYEKLLRDIATRGVVTLFNAIPKHQKQLKDSLENVDSNNDIFKYKTMKLEEQSRNKLIQSLNKSGKQQFTRTQNKNRKLENSNAKLHEPMKKKRRVQYNEKSNNNTLPAHLQSILMDNNVFNSKNSSHKNQGIDSDDSDLGKKQSITKPKQWNVLSDRMMLHGYDKDWQDVGATSEEDDDLVP